MRRVKGLEPSSQSEPPTTQWGVSEFLERGSGEADDIGLVPSWEEEARKAI